MAVETLEKTEKELSPAEKISHANNLEELENALRSAGSITGSEEKEMLIEGKRIRAKRAYSSGELIEKIKKVKNKELFLNGITREHGLREKVARLLIDDADSIEDLQERCGYKIKEEEMEVNGKMYNKYIIDAELKSIENIHGFMEIYDIKKNMELKDGEVLGLAIYENGKLEKIDWNEIN